MEIDEFDEHLIVHEWGHYFEDNFSRSDSIGGTHFLGDRLDARLAFGEGFATALAGMALDNPFYCDVFWSGGTLSGFDLRLENESTATNAGWYSEVSIFKMLYDFWDEALIDLALAQLPPGGCAITGMVEDPDAVRRRYIAA